MHPDHREYAKFTGPAQLEKSLNSLLGIVEGITIDKEINSREVGFLKMWLSEHDPLQRQHPYNELIPVVNQALEDGVLTEDERQDIAWLCEKLTASNYFDHVTADMQRLHAILGGIMVDGRVTEQELAGLSVWLQDHDRLKTCWPYDEVESLVTGVMRDRRIDDREQDMLKSFFSDFVALLDDRTITSPLVQDSASGTLVGLCAVDPEITFQGSTFCFTGASSLYKRKELDLLVTGFGGNFVDRVNYKVNYLVIGAEGNPCWAYACYGRKVEDAVFLRKQGQKILLVHENDFHDAVQDHV